MKIKYVACPDLLQAQEYAYEPGLLVCKNIVPEKESLDYNACSFEIHDKKIQFRTAKITPTKSGQFVTLWKRIDKGPIAPYDINDPVDFFVVSVRSDTHFGQFIFSKKILHEKGFISKEGMGGKRAMRVYPPWDHADSKQAKKTQDWQLLYFFEITLNKIIDQVKIKKLFDL